MNNRILLIVLLGMGAAYFSTHRQSKPQPLPETDRLKILAFEKQAECQAHSPCFDASVDGEMDNNPDNALAHCSAAVEKLSALRVPQGLPQDIAGPLEEFRLGLLSSANSFKNTALSKKGLPSENVSRISTCNTYAVINRVHKRYGLDKMMKGHYVNCAVLGAMKDI